ncbi:putative ATP-grasp-modified RiPP [Nonomuraea sp. SBT364]|uniref:putative ATP-grasp-modified RiPP n=1 Tax=Nonomuraea sp. SBT364 TaxID=1580530 RepID=UPI00066E1804
MRRSYVPWGVSRMAPFRSYAVAPYGVAIDPATQMGIYTDLRTGQVIEGAKHGSNVQRPTATEPPTPDGNGSGSGHGKQDSTTDWVSD